MKEVPIYEIKENVALRYAPIADEVRKTLEEKKTYLLNVMSSPGSGKTTLLVNLINKLKSEFKIGVIETDIDGREDPQKIFDDARLKEDVGIDSLDYVDIVAFVTRNYGFKIDKTKLKDVVTLRQLYDFIQQYA